MLFIQGQMIFRFMLGEYHNKNILYHSKVGQLTCVVFNPEQCRLQISFVMYPYIFNFRKRMAEEEEGKGKIKRM